MKKKLAMLLVAVVAIVSLAVVTTAPQPVALAEEDEDYEGTALIEAIGEITAELHNISETLKGLTPEEEKVKKGNIQWAGVSQVGGPMLESLQEMCDAIFDASDGRLQLTLLPPEEGPPGAEMFDAVDSGDIDFAVTPSMWWTDNFSAAELFCTRNGGMSPMEKYLWLISGGGAELAQEMIDGYNVYLVPGGGCMHTPDVFLHSSVPIDSVADLDGLKIRASGDSEAIFNELGAETVLLPPGEIYKAMEEERIDACDFSSPCLNWLFKFHEVAEYVYLSEGRTPHGYMPFLVNQDSWNELPYDLKVIVERITREEAITSYAEACQCDIEALEKFRGYCCSEYCCTVEPLSPDIEQAFLAAANAYYDGLAAGDPFYAEVLESQREFQETFRDTWPRP